MLESEVFLFYVESGEHKMLKRYKAFRVDFGVQHLDLNSNPHHLVTATLS